MPIKLIITPSADQSLQEISDFIAQDNPARAASFVDELQERLEKTLAFFPESGSPYQGNVRYFSIRGYIFLYEYDREAKAIYILDVYGKGENWR